MRVDFKGLIYLHSVSDLQKTHLQSCNELKYSNIAKIKGCITGLVLDCVIFLVCCLLMWYFILDSVIVPSNYYRMINYYYINRPSECINVIMISALGSNNTLSHYSG